MNKNGKQLSKEEEAYNSVMGIGEPKKFSNVDIVRGNNEQIIIPEGMSCTDAAEWLNRQAEADEADINVQYKIKHSLPMELMLFIAQLRKSLVSLLFVVEELPLEVILPK